MKFTAIFFILAFVPTLVFAENSDDNFDKDLAVEKTAPLPAEMEGEAAKPVEEVTRADLQKLSEAKKAKTESAMVEAAAQILSKDPNHVQALNALGVFYFENRKFGLAKIVLQRALKTHKEEPVLYNNLGIIYLAENDMGLAIESFKKSVQAKSNYKTGAANLSSIYVKYRDYKNSLAPLEEAYGAVRSDVRRGEDSAIEVASNYAVALMGLHEESKARKVFEEIVGSPTRNPVPYLNYAILLVEVQKEKKDAIRVISKLKFITEDRGILRRVQELEQKLE